MTRRTDPGGAMNVESDVALVGHLRLAAVEPDEEIDDRLRCKPGTDVLPTCSMAVILAPRTCESCVRSCSNSATQVGS
jgi:hypothetical protein